MRILVGIAGILLLLFSGFFIIAAISDLITGNTKTGRGILGGLLFFFMGTATASIFMIRAGFFYKVKVNNFEQEQRLLALAQSSGGRVTLSQAALHCRLSIDDAKNLLEEMARKGVAEVEVSDDGNFIYRFNGLSPR